MKKNFSIMNIEQLREYCLSKKDVEESFPFGDDTLVFKTNGKIFLLASLDTSPLQFNVKCEPDKAIQLREEFPDVVMPGYHMNKKHWNTIIVNGKLSEKQLYEMMDDSYNLVCGKANRKV
jgi:predicted DNA-binding protein (MmcQ/YjbR family)